MLRAEGGDSLTTYKGAHPNLQILLRKDNTILKPEIS